MSNKTTALLLASTALVGGLMFSTTAFAQSTGTTDVEAVVVTARTGPKTIQGAMIAETVSKNRNTITQEYIDRQPPGQTILQSLNLTPGLSFTNNDPFGSSGGNIRLHGQDGAHIGLLIDGVPLNDVGNYSVFSNQQLDPELIEQANINTGSTDVDTVTASSTGGIINYTTRKTAKEFGGVFDVSGGSYDYKRVFGLVDSGPIGPFGTRAYVAGSYQQYDKYKGPGDLEKKQVNLRIDQPIGSRGDFISILANYNENRNTFYYNPNLQTLAAPGVPNLTVPEVATFGWGVDYFDTFIPQTARNGVVDTVPTQDSAVKGFYGARVNPSNTGTIRALSRFTLLPKLHLTIDPAFNYTLANGGGAQTLNEATSLQVQNAAGVGRDINGDGDILDTVSVYGPSNTNSRRYSVNTSLIYDLTASSVIRFAYAYDRGKTRQTGEYSYLTADGFPMSVFSAKDGYDAQAVLDGAGGVAQKRNRDSVGELKQYAFEYRGRFFDDRLSFNAGVRIPELTRELNQFCYTQAGTSGANPFCTVRTPTVATTSPNAAVVQVSPSAVSQRVTFGTLTTTSVLYYRPFALKRTFDATLPNVGASFKLTPNITAYANYTESQSAPRVDNLYGLQANGIPTNVQPETSTSEDYGVRFQSRRDHRPDRRLPHVGSEPHRVDPRPHRRLDHRPQRRHGRDQRRGRAGELPPRRSDRRLPLGLVHGRPDAGQSVHRRHGDLSGRRASRRLRSPEGQAGRRDAEVHGRRPRHLRLRLAATGRAGQVHRQAFRHRRERPVGARLHRVRHGRSRWPGPLPQGPGPAVQRDQPLQREVLRHAGRHADDGGRGRAGRRLALRLARRSPRGAGHAEGRLLRRTLQIDAKGRLARAAPFRLGPQALTRRRPHRQMRPPPAGRAVGDRPPP